MSAVGAVREAMANLCAAYDALDACDVDSLTGSEVVSMIDDYQTLTCRMPTQWHRLLTRLQAETTPAQMGAKSWNEVLRIRWRLSTAEASRRLHEAADLAARTSLTGQPLAPVLPAVAAAQSAGVITGEHVTAIRDAIKACRPGSTPPPGRSSRWTWCASRPASDPKNSRETAALRLFLLDQDGPEPDDAERARKRRVTTGRQGRDAMTAAERRTHPRGVGGVGSDLRQIRRAGDVQPRRRRAMHLGHPDPGPDRQRRPHPGPTPARRACSRSGASR